MSEAKVTAIVPSRAPSGGQELYRASTDAAHLCKEIVVQTAVSIQGRKYVKVEGWMSIAIAHGCMASAGEVERVSDPDCPGYRAIGRVLRADTGQVLTTAEGFVGDDETTWAKRPIYARRAMAQTRAISRACRSAFAHVVVMMNAGLETTPAEEVPLEGFEPAPHSVASAKAKIRAAAEVLDGEVVESTLAEARKVANPRPGEYTMKFPSKDGHWEVGAPISSLETEHLRGLAKWKNARDDLKAACLAEIAAREEP